jgi:hypothetical protein
MRCAVNNLGTVKGDLLQRRIAPKENCHGIDSDYRCPGAAVWRRRRILWAPPRVLVIERGPLNAGLCSASRLGFITYNGSAEGGIEIHSSLLNAVLRDQPHIKT